MMTRVILMVSNDIKEDRIPSQFKSDLKFAVMQLINSHIDWVGASEVKCLLREHIMAARHKSITIPILIINDGKHILDDIKVIGYQELKANG